MEWLIAANHNKYNHTKAFNELPYIDWKQSASYGVGDLVYIYASSPVSAIEYLVEVVKIDIDVNDAIDDVVYWNDLDEYYNGRNKRKYVRFKLIHQFTNNQVSLTDLHRNGLKGNIQGPRKLLDEHGDMLQVCKYIHDRLDCVINNNEKIISSIEDDIKGLNLEGKTKEIIVKARLNQCVFRESLLKRYSSCCMCNIKSKQFLIASHIKPWSVSASSEKLDVDNGLLLCPNHDALFDDGYISFDNEGNLLVSDELSQNDRIFMNVNEGYKIQLTSGNRKYLEYHRKNVFRNNK